MNIICIRLILGRPASSIFLIVCEGFLHLFVFSIVNFDPELNKVVSMTRLKPNENGELQLKIGTNTKRNKYYLKLKNFRFHVLRALYAYLCKPNVQSQVIIFERSMQYFIICGQCLGLFPILDIANRTPPKKKFPIISWRYLLCIIIFVGETVATVLSFRRLMNSRININTIAFFAFYFTNSVTTVLFMRVGSKWHQLVQQVAAAELDAYVQPRVHCRCSFATVLIVLLSLIEHLLSINSRYTIVQDCFLTDDKYEAFINISYPWFSELDIYSLPLGIYLPIQNIPTTINWTYSHLFIICVSLYLTSILEEINNKIVSREGQYLPASYWRALREDYTRATRLVRSFDDVINSIVFVSFASNLFFVCLQLNFVLTHGLKVRDSFPGDKCPNYPSGIFNGYEHTVYYSFSLCFVVLRSLAVSLAAARVHSASLLVAPSLYTVPSPAYCTEVQRFIEQVHRETVALTGLNFFYVTKELVLSVVGTIATYELVLLQFSGAQSHD